MDEKKEAEGGEAEMAKLVERDILRRRWPWPWPFGIPADFWLVHEKGIMEFIKEHKLEPVRARVKEMGYAEEQRVIDIDYITGQFGGKRIAHLHYRGDMYLLDANQWREFSGTVLKDFSKKLAEAHTVNFEQFMELANVMNAMP